MKKVYEEFIKFLEDNDCLEDFRHNVIVDGKYISIYECVKEIKNKYSLVSLAFPYSYGDIRRTFQFWDRINDRWNECYDLLLYNDNF